jgi:hypothetical protein
MLDTLIEQRIALSRTLSAFHSISASRILFNLRSASRRKVVDTTGDIHANEPNYERVMQSDLQPDLEFRVLTDLTEVDPEETGNDS